MKALTATRQLLRAAPPLAWSPAGSYSLRQGAVAAPQLRLLPDLPVGQIESLPQYSARIQRQIAAAEGVAFAALTAASLAGVLAGFYF